MEKVYVIRYGMNVAGDLTSMNRFTMHDEKLLRRTDFDCRCTIRTSANVSVGQIEKIVKMSVTCILLLSEDRLTKGKSRQS